MDYLGFTIDDHFVVGYGLDYGELYRNLPFIGILEPDEGSSSGTGSEIANRNPKRNRSDEVPGDRRSAEGDRPLLAGRRRRRLPVRVGPDPARPGARASSSAGRSSSRAERIFDNLEAVLQEAGLDLRRRRQDDGLPDTDGRLPRDERRLREALRRHRPARSTVMVAALPKGATLEIDLIARTQDADREAVVRRANGPLVLGLETRQREDQGQART